MEGFGQLFTAAESLSDAAAEGGTYSVTCQGSDDFAGYMDASRSLQNAEHSLSQILNASI